MASCNQFIQIQKGNTMFLNFKKSKEVHQLLKTHMKATGYQELPTATVRLPLKTCN